MNAKLQSAQEDISAYIKGSYPALTFFVTISDGSEEMSFGTERLREPHNEFLDELNKQADEEEAKKQEEENEGEEAEEEGEEEEMEEEEEEEAEEPEKAE